MREVRFEDGRAVLAGEALVSTPRLPFGLVVLVTDSLPLQGPEKVDCPDGCGQFGRPVKKRSGHVRGCPCISCRNGRNSSQGKARHRRFAKNAGIRQGWKGSSDEEAWRDHFRWEIKSGKQVDPVVTRYELARAQSELTRPIGDPRPFAFGVEPTEQGRPSLVLIDVEVWNGLIVPLLEAAL